MPSLTHEGNKFKDFLHFIVYLGLLQLLQLCLKIKLRMDIVGLLVEIIKSDYLIVIFAQKPISFHFLGKKFKLLNLLVP